MKATKLVVGGGSEKLHMLAEVEKWRTKLTCPFWKNQGNLEMPFQAPSLTHVKYSQFVLILGTVLGHPH